MAGPVPTYLTTQLAAQTAFNVPFGLLALVNSSIATATAAGEFNVTVDCSLFTAEDVSNLRIYLDSEGYKVEFAKDANQKSLNIDWGTFLDIPGQEVIADQGSPNSLANAWPVEITDGTNVLGTPAHPVNVTGTFTDSPSTNANITSVVVTTSSTVLVGTNLSRKGLVFQSKDSDVYYILGTTPATTSVYSYFILRLNSLELNDFFGTVSAVVGAGTASVQVTEKI